MSTTKDKLLINFNLQKEENTDAAAVGQFERHETDDFSISKLEVVKGRKRLRIMVSLWSIFTDVSSILVGFLAASLIYLGKIEIDHVGNMIAICIPLFLLFSLNNNAHNTPEVKSLWSGIASAAAALLLAGASLLLFVFFLKIGAEFSRVVFFLGVTLSLSAVVAMRTITRAFLNKKLSEGMYSILYVFDGVKVDRGLGAGAIDARAAGLHPDLSSAVAVNRLGKLAEDMDRVVVYCAPQARDAWAMALKTLDVRCEIVIPELDVFGALNISMRSGHTSLLLNSGRLPWNQKIIKRMFDLLISFAVLPFLLLFFLLVGLCILLDSRGPVYFRQERVGLGNRSFMIWKFRTMRAEESDPLGIRSTSRDDDRITRVGKVLRRTSIDELPQIFNVISGNMSLVGPRPHALGSRAENALFWDIDQRYWQRHVVKPGLTGLAQIRGFRGATERKIDLTMRLQSDLEYASHWSLINDIRILIGTIAVLLHKNAF